MIDRNFGSFAKGTTQDVYGNLQSRLTSSPKEKIPCLRSENKPLKNDEVSFIPLVKK